MGTPLSSGRQMSASLRERLKKCGRVYKSPSEGSMLRQQQQTVGTASLGASSSSSSSLTSPSLTGPAVTSPTTSESSNLGLETVAACIVTQLADSPRDNSPKSTQDGLDCMRLGETVTLLDFNDCNFAGGTASNCNRLAENASHEALGCTNCEGNQLDDACHKRVTPNIVRKRSRGQFELSCKRQCLEASPSQVTSAVHGDERSPEKSSDSSPESAESPSAGAEDDGMQSCDRGLRTQQDECGIERQQVKVIPVDFKVEEASLRSRIGEKEERLRKLLMVKMYRKKNNLAQLECLIQKWREASQLAIQRLFDLAPDPKPTLTDLVNQLGLDHGMICYNQEDESFT